MIDKLFELKAFFEGKKTFLTVAVAFILGGLQAVGVEVPEIVFVLLGFAGLGFVRASVPKA